MAKLAAGYAWCLPAVVLLASLFETQRVVLTEPFGVTSWMVVASPLLLIGIVLLPWASSVGALWQGSWWALGAFSAVLVWATIRSLGPAPCLGLHDGEVYETCFAGWVSWVPLLQAGITAALAWVVVACVADSWRSLWLVAMSAAVVLGAVLALARSPLHPAGFNRLGSGLGGPAVLAVALVIAAACLAGWLRWHQGHSWMTGVGLAVALVLIILTFSRAGLAAAVLCGGVLLWRSRANTRARYLGWVLAALAGITTIVACLMPDYALRLVSLGDQARAENAVLSLEWWLRTPLVGAGTGQVWPWFGVDAQQVFAPETGLYAPLGMSGQVLVSPHSTFLAVLVEQGVIGFLPLLVLLGGVAFQALKGQAATVASWALLGAACTIPAFFVDTYLLRNPGVSFIWWVGVFAGLASGSNNRMLQVGAGATRVG